MSRCDKAGIGCNSGTYQTEDHFTSDFCNNSNSTETLSVIQFLSIWSLELWHESIAIMLYAVFYGDHLDENRTNFLLHSSYGKNLPVKCSLAPSRLWVMGLAGTSSQSRTVVEGSDFPGMVYTQYSQ